MRLTPKDIYNKKQAGEKIVAISAYDFPFAKIADTEGVDILLVGDSLGMVLYGYSSTREVTMEEMLAHTRAVNRAVEHALVVADMPFESYKDSEQAVRNAKLFLQAGADAVKVEGGVQIRTQVDALLKAKIAVMGHVGMTPQTADKLGGYRVQGRSAAESETIFKDASVLDDLGVFSVVLECIPKHLGKKISHVVKCPTIGIGAGPETNGQVLVMHDLLGFKAEVSPKFVRAYADMDQSARKAVAAYRDDVRGGGYPSLKESYS